jgi:ABC-type dipeptide/oligopeptide/nickel transport system permease subunit
MAGEEAAVRAGSLGASGLAALGLMGAVLPAPRPAGAGSALPSWSHPLGLDAAGLDFVRVLAEGASDFVVPGVVAVLALYAVLVLRCLFAAIVPPVGVDPAAPAHHRLILASPPRLLLVLVVLLMLPEPSPAAAAVVVWVLRLPVAIVDAEVALSKLQGEEVLAGGVAHGLSPSRIAARHLALGWLRPLFARHGAVLFAEVAATHIAIAYMLGASAVTPGMGHSWGMELRRLGAQLPASGMGWCRPDGSCPASAAAIQIVALVLACVVLLGGVARLQETEDRSR